jgi:hypothetical protein
MQQRYKFIPLRKEHTILFMKAKNKALSEIPEKRQTESNALQYIFEKFLQVNDDDRREPECGSETGNIKSNTAAEF